MGRALCGDGGWRIEMGRDGGSGGLAEIWLWNSRSFLRRLECAGVRGGRDFVAESRLETEI